MNDLKERSQKIAELNDALRAQCAAATALQYGRVFVTRGVHALGPRHVAGVLRAVAAFDAFGADNEPYREHDFGSIEAGGETIFWKIDAYQKGSDYLAGADAPENEHTTDRVLTIMLATEY
jgi:hypothetical protein